MNSEYWLTNNQPLLQPLRNLSCKRDVPYRGCWIYPGLGTPVRLVQCLQPGLCCHTLKPGSHELCRIRAGRIRAGRSEINYVELVICYTKTLF